MSKNTDLNEITPIEPQKKEVRAGKLTTFRFVSGIIAALAIVGLCIWQALVSAGVQSIFYVILAVIGLAFGVFITVTYIKQNKKDK